MTDQALDPPPSSADRAPTQGPLPADPPGVPEAPGPAGGPHPAVRQGARAADDGIVGPLPALDGPFVGRTRELAQLRAEIERPGLGAARRQAAGKTEGDADGRARVLLVVGRPGVGRTALAVRLAHEVADDYPDGRFFVALTAPGGEPVPPERAVRTLLRALRAEPAGPQGAAGAPRADADPATALPDGPDTPAAPRAGRETATAVPAGPGTAIAWPGGSDAVTALGEAMKGRRLLLVLDDAPRGAELAGLLPRSARSLVVVTSDGPLSGVPDVRPCTLGGLDTPAAVELLSHTIGDTRVTNDPRAAEALVQEAAGHPTALRLIAVWLAARPRLSVADAAQRIRTAPDTPLARPASDGTASAPGELVRAFRVVYEGLPGAAGRMLRLLTLAPWGAVDAQVASALAGCSVGAAQSTLDDFVAGALLHPGGGERQYRVPGCLEPLLRGLVASRDRPEDVELARARMLERTVRLLHACRAALAGEAPADGLPRTLRFDSAEAAADWLRARLPALLAAARVAVADGGLDTLARRLVAALVRALTASAGGETTAAERYELHSLVLGVAERRGLPREKAAALINLADLDAESGRTDRALATYREALEAARAGEDTEAEGRVLEALGGTYLELRDLPRASDWFGRALALRQARGELPHQARLHARIGSILTHLGRYGPALREWRSAVGVHRRLGDLPAQARALTETARVQEYAGHPEDALRTCRDALYWARQAGERRLEAAVLLRLADTLDRLGDPGGARLQRAAAERLFRPGEFPAF